MLLEKKKKTPELAVNSCIRKSTSSNKTRVNHLCLSPGQPCFLPRPTVVYTDATGQRTACRNAKQIPADSKLVTSWVGVAGHTRSTATILYVTHPRAQGRGPGGEKTLASSRGKLRVSTCLSYKRGDAAPRHPRKQIHSAGKALQTVD